MPLKGLMRAYVCHFNPLSQPLCTALILVGAILASVNVASAQERERHVATLPLGSGVAVTAYPKGARVEFAVPQAGSFFFTSIRAHDAEVFADTLAHFVDAPFAIPSAGEVVRYKIDLRSRGDLPPGDTGDIGVQRAVSAHGSTFLVDFIGVNTTEVRVFPASRQQVVLLIDALRRAAFTVRGMLATSP